jgi:hypothetical protein
MPRIYIPEIPDEIVNMLTSVESTLEWIKRLELAAKRLQEELKEIEMVLKFVVYPKYNALQKEESLRKV